VNMAKYIACTKLWQGKDAVKVHKKTKKTRVFLAIKRALEGIVARNNDSLLKRRDQISYKP
jgi:hypothetical protein